MATKTRANAQSAIRTAIKVATWAALFLQGCADNRASTMCPEPSLDGQYVYLDSLFSPEALEEMSGAVTSLGGRPVVTPYARTARDGIPVYPATKEETSWWPARAMACHDCVEGAVLVNLQEMPAGGIKWRYTLLHELGHHFGLKDWDGPGIMHQPDSDVESAKGFCPSQDSQEVQARK